MIREIRKLGDPILTKKAEKVRNIDGLIISLVRDLLETMKFHDGWGIAAPQVGISKAIALVKNLSNPDGPPIVFINPTISFRSEDTNEDYEACLSVPDVMGLVDRSNSIKVKFQDQYGKFHTNSYESFQANICQHELDHLAGILFLSRAKGDLVPLRALSAEALEAIKGEDISKVYVNKENLELAKTGNTFS